MIGDNAASAPKNIPPVDGIDDQAPRLLRRDVRRCDGGRFSSQVIVSDHATKPGRVMTGSKVKRERLIVDARQKIAERGQIRGSKIQPVVSAAKEEAPVAKIAFRVLPEMSEPF